MYATAQKVESESGLKRGINTFYHRHPKGLTTPDTREVIRSEDVVRIAETFPGELVRVATDVQPGGNLVMSYLDVTAPDEAGVEEIKQALVATEKLLEKDNAPVERNFGRVGVRFCFQNGLTPRCLEEYRALKENVLAIVENRIGAAPVREEPLVVVTVASDAEKAVYSLNLESLQRLSKKLGRQLTLIKVTVAHGVRSDFQREYGNVLPHIVAVLSGLSTDQVAVMGGFRLLDTDGHPIYEWPERVAPVVE